SSTAWRSPTSARGVTGSPPGEPARTPATSSRTARPGTPRPGTLRPGAPASLLDRAVGPVVVGEELGDRTIDVGLLLRGLAAPPHEARRVVQVERRGQQVRVVLDAVAAVGAEPGTDRGPQGRGLT